MSEAGRRTNHLDETPSQWTQLSWVQLTVRTLCKVSKLRIPLQIQKCNRVTTTKFAMLETRTKPGGRCKALRASRRTPISKCRPSERRRAQIVQYPLPGTRQKPLDRALTSQCLRRAPRKQPLQFCTQILITLKIKRKQTPATQRLRCFQNKSLSKSNSTSRRARPPN